LIIEGPFVRVNGLEDLRQVMDFPWAIPSITLRDKGVLQKRKELHFSLNLTIT
jgi:hypothetical protein